MTPEEAFTETLSKIDKEIQTTTAYGRYDWLKDVRDRLCLVLAELGELEVLDLAKIQGLR
jgi:hypothetical protein